MLINHLYLGLIPEWDLGIILYLYRVCGILVGWYEVRTPTSSVKALSPPRVFATRWVKSTLNSIVCVYYWSHDLESISNPDQAPIEVPGLWTFNREGSLYLACNDKNAFFTSEQPKRYKLWSCLKICDALHYLLDNIFIRFGSKLYRQIVGILMGTNCAPLVADLFLFCYERLYVVSVRQ